MEKERFSRNPLWLFDAVSSEMAQWSMQLVKLAALLRRYIVCHVCILSLATQTNSNMIRPFSHESKFNWVLNMHDSDRRRRFGTVAFGQLDPSGAIHFTLYAKSGCQPWTRRSEFRNSFKKKPLKHSSNLDPDGLWYSVHIGTWLIFWDRRNTGHPHSNDLKMSWPELLKYWLPFFRKNDQNAPFPDKPTWKFQRFQCTDRGRRRLILHGSHEHSLILEPHQSVIGIGFYQRSQKIKITTIGEKHGETHRTLPQFTTFFNHIKFMFFARSEIELSSKHARLWQKAEIWNSRSKTQLDPSHRRYALYTSPMDANHEAGDLNSVSPPYPLVN